MHTVEQSGAWQSEANRGAALAAHNPIHLA
jgi:hypothetical protein